MIEGLRVGFISHINLTVDTEDYLEEDKRFKAVL